MKAYYLPKFAVDLEEIIAISKVFQSDDYSYQFDVILRGANSLPCVFKDADREEAFLEREKLVSAWLNL